MGIVTKILPILACLALPAKAEISQTEAQKISADLNKKGSDDSLKLSTTLAMQALMKLSNSDMPGAINKGYDAFGKYQNSENMDDIKSQNNQYKNAMSSVGTSFVSGQSSGPTSYRRLDPSFLHEGEAGKVADEFEKMSGMKREVFLKNLATAAENPLNPSDPELFKKALARGDIFLQQIPNKEFRAKLERIKNMVPDSLKEGLLAKAVSTFFGATARLAGKNQTESKITAPGSGSASSKAEGKPGAIAADATSDRKPSSDIPAEPKITRALIFEDDGGKLDGMAGLAQTAINESGEDISIFQRVKNKIRQEWPELK